METIKNLVKAFIGESQTRNGFNSEYIMVNGVKPCMVNPVWGGIIEKE